MLFHSVSVCELLCCARGLWFTRHVTSMMSRHSSFTAFLNPHNSIDEKKKIILRSFPLVSPLPLLNCQWFTHLYFLSQILPSITPVLLRMRCPSPYSPKLTSGYFSSSFFYEQFLLCVCILLPSDTCRVRADCITVILLVYGEQILHYSATMLVIFSG